MLPEGLYGTVSHKNVYGARSYLLLEEVEVRWDSAQPRGVERCDYFIITTARLEGPSPYGLAVLLRLSPAGQRDSQQASGPRVNFNLQSFPRPYQIITR